MLLPFYPPSSSFRLLGVISLRNSWAVHLLEQMKEIAKRNNRSLNGEILTAIEEHLKRYQKGK